MHAPCDRKSAPTPKRRLSRSGRRKLKLLTRNALDGRTTAAKRFDAIAAAIAVDLGGEDQLSTVQKHLVLAFAGIALHLGDCNARLLLGEAINILEHAHVVSTLVRVAQRVGIERRAKPVPDLYRDVLPALATKRDALDGAGDG
jgi:hypothetical protein